MASKDIKPLSSLSESPHELPPSVPKPGPAKQRAGIYPPILPPPDFFDPDDFAEKLKDMFKISNPSNPLDDETGRANLPHDTKGILILDPETRTRLIDAKLELDTLGEYWRWIQDVKRTGRVEGQGEAAVEWLKGLQKAVHEDRMIVARESHRVVDEERLKRGLTRWEDNRFWRKTHGGGQLMAEDGDTESSEDEEVGGGGEGDEMSIERAGDGGSSSVSPSLARMAALESDQTASSKLAREASTEVSWQPGSSAPEPALARASNASPSTPSASEFDSPTPQIDLLTLWW